MKQLTTYIKEDFKISRKVNVHKYHPKTFQELRAIILTKYKYNKGNEYFDLRDIDVTNVDTFYPEKSTVNLFTYKYTVGIPVKIIDITGWNTSNQETFCCMFAECRNLEKIIGIENLDVSMVSDFDGMFYDCENLRELDLSKWFMQHEPNVRRMFYYCSRLHTLKGVEDWDVSQKKVHAFTGCKTTILPSWYDRINDEPNT